MFSLSDSYMDLIFILAVVSSVAALIALIMTFVLSSRMNKFQKAYVTLQTFISGTKLEDVLKANLKEVRELNHQLANHESRIHRAEDKLRGGIDRAELIRFNSFDNMGAELSFALALLNQEGTGMVLTGIHSIEECRVYAKPIEKGQAMVKLNQEEKQAIERACNTIKV
ncbi:MAG: hypothetical protein AWM53_01137 [Candidatus Dichloromethanomonas elyunquensis]|nr:MAG: hypothetical protein AWM53_01137 [Candidatus Dichloromethanomonas elyunquensis]